MSLDLLAEVRVNAGAVSGLAILDVSAGNQNFPTVDRLGFRGLAYFIGGDPNFSGDCNFYMQHSDDAVTWVDVPVDLLRNRSAAAVTAGTAGLLGSLASLGLRGVLVGTLSKKRYVRLRQGDSATPTGILAFAVLRFNPTRAPVTQVTW